MYVYGSYFLVAAEERMLRPHSFKPILLNQSSISYLKLELLWRSEIGVKFKYTEIYFFNV